MQILCLGMISEYLYGLFYAGEIQDSKAGNGNVFFPNSRFARADKAVALQVPQPVKHRHQRIATLGVIVGR